MCLGHPQARLQGGQIGQMLRHAIVRTQRMVGGEVLMPAGGGNALHQGARVAGHRRLLPQRA